MQTITLAEAARRTGIPESTLRYRAKVFKRVLHPTRSKRWKGVRYPEDDVDIFQAIHAMLDEGLDAPVVEEKLLASRTNGSSGPELGGATIIDLSPDERGTFVPGADGEPPHALVQQLGLGMREAVRTGVQEATASMVQAVEQFSSHLERESGRSRAAEERLLEVERELANTRAELTKRAEQAEAGQARAEAALEQQKADHAARADESKVLSDERVAQLKSDLTKARSDASQARQQTNKARRELESVRERMEESVTRSLAEAAELRGSLEPLKQRLEESKARVARLEQELAEARLHSGASGILRKARSIILEGR